ncbi:cell division protein SepF [Candidatus Pacearchaeota archaeon]|nr:MAG: cell division protein SepF [Candidatus Pacearchaeota archaeon]
MAFDLKKFFKKHEEEEYVEIDLDSLNPQEEKILVRPFVLKHMDDLQDILNALREGYTIVVIDIKPMKTKDLIELKRAIAKLKKTVDAIEGSIAGFGENIVIATPSFAHVHKPTEKKKKEKTDFIGV